MAIKTIPLSRLEANLRAALNECADSGYPLAVELPDQRLLAIQLLETADDDSLVDDLLQSNPEFQSLVERSKVGPRKRFTSGPGKSRR